MAIIEHKHNCCQALKHVLDFYDRQKHLSGAVEDDWQKHVAKFVSIDDEYGTDAQTRLANFMHSLKPTSQAW